MSEKKSAIAKIAERYEPPKLPKEEAELMYREDRLGKYLKKNLKMFVFAEFSPEYLAKSKAGEIMAGVPIPLRKEDLQDFAGGAGINATVLAENMAFVMGCDPHFEYCQAYKDFLLKLFNYKIYEGMLKKGRDAAEREEFEYACIQFRATLVMKPDYIHGMYSYARVCRSLYMDSKDGEYIGRFKAESIEYFELLTQIHPKFAQAYYYLGYAYLNLGLYAKAELTWRNFTRRSRNNKDIKEIKGRIKQIEDPMKIEEGYNSVLRGQFEKGIEILEGYTSTQFNDWWPLHYYLGVSYAKVGNKSKAMASFLRVLPKNPAHLETMEEMITIYKEQKDRENVDKYQKKIEIIKKDLERERKELEGGPKEKELSIKFAGDDKKGKVKDKDAIAEAKKEEKALKKKREEEKAEKKPGKPKKLN